MQLTKKLIEKAKDAYTVMEDTKTNYYIKMNENMPHYIDYMVLKDHWYFGKGYQYFQGGEYLFTFNKELFE